VFNKIGLLKIIEEQRKEIQSQKTGLPRSALETLPNLQTHAAIISGVRRCGKSTLLLQRLKKEKSKSLYLGFDDIRLTDFDSQDLILLGNIIKDGKYKTLFLDEPQIVDKWEVFVKSQLEYGVKVFATGSNASLLSRELGTRLTGRHITKELFPFSYKEFIRFKKMKAQAASFQKYIDMGGFPEYLATQRIDVLTHLFSDVLYRDIIVRHGVRDGATLKKIAVYLMANVANMVSANRLQEPFGTNSNTILEYLSYFEDTYLINLVPKFSYSMKMQNRHPKKIYVIDSALQKAASASFTKDYGRLLENAVYWHLRRKSEEIYYFNENNRECDFVLCQNGAPAELVQVCYDFNRETMEREQKGLKEAMDFFKINNAKIITYNQDDMYIQDRKKIMLIPAWKYMA